MKPYYEDDAVTICHDNCTTALAEWANYGGRPYPVDLVVTSPPYNLSGDDWAAWNAGQVWSGLAGGYEGHDDAMPHDAYVAWQRDVLANCWRLLADDGAIFYVHKPILRGNAVRLPLELIPPSLPLRQVVIWDRGSGFNRNASHFCPTHEWVMVIAKPAFRLRTRALDDVWRIPYERGNPHPAPFPTALAARIIGATDAELILDPFMGSGSTLRAAKDLGRKAIGIESAERYCEIAVKRLSQEVLDFGGVA